MFNKINTRYLFIAFAVLLTLALLTVPAGNNRKNRSFKSEITNFDPDQVSSITLYPRAAGELITFRKSGDNWLVSDSGGEYNADNSQVDNLVNSLSNLRAKRLAANKKESWAKYEVTDSLGTRVELFDGEKGVADLYIGKFSYTQPSQPASPYQQPQGTMTSFVRSHRENEVFAVDGYLGMYFNRQVKDYRDGNILRVTDSAMKRISLSNPGEQFSLLNQDSLWTLQGTIVDSATMAGYLSDIRSVRSTYFLTNEQLPVGNPTHQLTLEGENGEVIARVDGYFGDSTHIVVGSTMNPGTFFDGTRSDLFSKLFRRQSSFAEGQ